jgi:hypothetical protein
VRQYNPNWPFPQFDEDGEQLLPEGWNKPQPKPEVNLEDYEDALY